MQQMLLCGNFVCKHMQPSQMKQLLMLLNLQEESITSQSSSLGRFVGLPDQCSTILSLSAFISSSTPPVCMAVTLHHRFHTPAVHTLKHTRATVSHILRCPLPSLPTRARTSPDLHPAHPAPPAPAPRHTTAPTPAIQTGQTCSSTHRHPPRTTTPPPPLILAAAAAAVHRATPNSSSSSRTARAASLGQRPRAGLRSLAGLG